MTRLEREKIGDALRHERVTQDVEADLLAETTGVSTKHINNIEAGSNGVSLDTLKRLAYALGLHLHELLAKADI